MHEHRHRGSEVVRVMLLGQEQRRKVEMEITARRATRAGVTQGGRELRRASGWAGGSPRSTRGRIRTGPGVVRENAGCEHADERGRMGCSGLQVSKSNLGGVL
jgi:hypothetical protein